LKQKNIFDDKTYFSFCCTINAESAELWSWFCFEKGALGVETLAEDSNELTLRIFFSKKPERGVKKYFECFQREINEVCEIRIFEEVIQPIKNWGTNWHQNFHPVEVGESLIILPSWKNGIIRSGRHPVWIEPGQGFGTGNHLSTVLALEMLEKFLSETHIIPENMLDLGIGSGILAIAACRLGLKTVTGVDIETEAVVEVERNSKLNGLLGRINSHVGRPSLLKKSAPLVVSNMLLKELLGIRHDMYRLTSPGGTLICSGLFGEQEEELRNSMMELGFAYQTSLVREKWNAIRFQRHGKQ